MSHPTVTLSLPLPPSRNQINGMHHMEMHKAAGRYKTGAWFRACGQHAPRHPDDLPERVDLHIEFYRKRLIDPDNLDLKWPIDVLKAKQLGKTRWKQNLGIGKGYIRDDTEFHCRIIGVHQRKADNIEPCVVVKITPRED